MGFMLPTWFLSMWVTNTATTAMVMPIVESVIRHMESSTEDVVDTGQRNYNLGCKRLLYG